MGFQAHFFLPLRSLQLDGIRGTRVLDSALQARVERTVTGLGYELVEFVRAGGGLLRVTIERPGYVPRPDELAQGGVTVEDCERVSHQLSHLFTVESVDYDRLEVGSPGVDRPLASLRDFARFAGSLAKVHLHAAIDGMKRLTGRIVGVEGDHVVLELLAPHELPEAQKALPRSPSKRTTRKVASAPRPRVAVAFKDVEKARLVPELNFRSSRS